MILVLTKQKGSGILIQTDATGSITFLKFIMFLSKLGPLEVDQLITEHLFLYPLYLSYLLDLVGNPPISKIDAPTDFAHHNTETDQEHHGEYYHHDSHYYDSQLGVLLDRVIRLAQLQSIQGGDRVVAIWHFRTARSHALVPLEVSLILLLVAVIKCEGGSVVRVVKSATGTLYESTLNKTVS